MLRGERQPLSQQEITSVLTHRLSYLANDLVVPTWNAAGMSRGQVLELTIVLILILELVLFFMGIMT